MKQYTKKMLDRYDYSGNVPIDGLTINGRPALTAIDPSKIGEYVIVLVRDPLCAYDEDDPAKQVADLLDNAELVGKSGMFTTYSGYYQGAHISVVSGGSGSPEAELLMVEFLEHTNANTFIRVGGSGGTNEQVRPGDLVLAKGVVRDEGMTRSYISASYPAATDHELLLALIQAAEETGSQYHVGITRSSDSDYVGGGRPSVRGYLQPEHIEVVDYYQRAGVLNGDRESAAIVTLASLFGKRGGSICSVADNIVTGEKFKEGAGHNEAIKVALRGLAVLHQMDQEKKENGSTYWLPKFSKKNVQS